MLECEEQDHNQQEIILICINVDCQIKRSCCIDCIVKHNSHKQDLKSINQITKWKKSTTNDYEIYQKKITQIVEIMSQAQKYVSCFVEDLEKSFDEIMIEEFEKQVCNLLRIQQLSSSFNQLTSNLETFMEPISQIFSTVESSSKDKWVKAQPPLNITKNQYQNIAQEQSIQKEQQIDFENKEPKQEKQMKKFENLDLIRKENGFNIYQYPRYYKSSIECLEEYKTIILIGTQNSDKQNLINLFVNYYYGVEFSDNYRFEIMDDIDISKDRQNDEYQQMKVYYVTPSNGQSGLRIIYTLDYNDDLSYDDQNKTDTIQNVIYNSASLNQNILIGFVIPQQVQIGTFFMLESILSRFPNILINNILFLFPDCTDEFPKQKQTLQSKTEMINGILSPVFKMIPTKSNFWYLQFNTSVVYQENKKKQNQVFWEMGKNSFQLLLSESLSNKINCNILLEMKCKYDEFFKVINFSMFTEQMKEMFLFLYKRENFQIQFLQQYENIKQKLEDFLDFSKTKTQQQNGPIHYLYYFQNNDEGFKQPIEKIMKDYNYFIEQNIQKFRDFQILIKNKDDYNQDFEHFYEQFKNFGSFMEQQYKSWQQYFKFNSILTSINHGQGKYYELLNSKEQSLIQEGWQERAKLLTKTSKSFQYFDGLIKLPNLEQLINQWFDQYFSEKGCTINKYYKITWQFTISIYWVLDVVQVELFKNYQQLQIKKRISEDCDKHFDNFILRILQDILN
ncbi:unnamed protein product [Paramecium octaurelia]|uniref:Uncharacterized protein n=1 Tax=Paramecium octaurelia TaxID=43137 RepID=A0A8S1UIW8_PAROT|nr:unnamed protein product [Paramecium octaurelia]